MAAPKTAAGWYPVDPNGRMGYWDGSAWIDPMTVLEERLGEVVGQHLERMYELGFEAGVSTTTQLLANIR